MPAKFLIGVEEQKQLDRKDSYFGHVFVTAVSLDSVSYFLHRNANTISVYVDATALTSVEATTVLINRALMIFVTQAQFYEIHSNSWVEDLSRLVIVLEAPIEKLETEIASVHDISRAVNFCLRAESFQLVRNINLTGISSQVFVDFGNGPGSDFKQAVTDGLVPILPAVGCQISPEPLLLSNLVTDRPDRLYPTVVVDERGICLGLVYSSEKSIQESVRTGTGVYQSRTRGLWYKGETSGDVQQLVRIEPDCDCDALRFTVKQEGVGM